MSASHYTEQMKIGMVHPAALAPAFVFLAGIDAAFAAGQRFNAYQLSEARRVAGARVESARPPARGPLRRREATVSAFAHDLAPSGKPHGLGECVRQTMGGLDQDLRGDLDQRTRQPGDRAGDRHSER